MSKNGMIGKPDPWRVPVVVAQLPDTGLHRDIEADAATRRAMADVADLPEVLSANASFNVMPRSGGRFHVTGHVKARVGQTCVVTLEPIENDIDAPIDLMFAPPDQIPQLADLVDEAAESDEEIPDPPEPIVNGIIDLGRLATDALLLAINPYPRKPDAVFEPLVEAADPGAESAEGRAEKVRPEEAEEQVRSRECGSWSHVLVEADTVHSRKSHITT
jgi:uncharacterized metal-binding protein YceD (DUF177 family)